MFLPQQYVYPLEGKGRRFGGKVVVSLRVDHEPIASLSRSIGALVLIGNSCEMVHKDLLLKVKI